MKPAELVAIIKNEKPELLAKIPEKRAIALVREALAQIGEQIAAVDKGVLKVQGLGSFRVNQVEREINGEKTMVKIVRFAKEKPKIKKKIESEEIVPKQ
ncbi:MAG: hypothetical protein A2511_17470 [Deltaproteobacteria bacterium RIFOXYD12_FULL_50_9]|nr:MAG: hypothetical protein A2511_17470 [Deltaproteobacteria bacterium RIFOXYD12_FULL_50_9]